jgi:DivIVA domain-containing protein
MNTDAAAEAVHNVAFSKPPIGKRGYNQDEVDAFLDFLEAALRDPARRALLPDQVRNVAFAKPPIGKRGYNEDEVDAFLDDIARQVEGSPPVTAAGPEPVGDQPPPRYSMKIRPILFLFWTPRWHDWRSDGSSTDSSGGSDNILVDLVLELVLPLLLNVLWNWFLWVVWAAAAWVVEACAAVVLSPISLLTSLLGLRRHKLVAVAKNGGDDLLLDQGSWYAMRRARARAFDQIAAEDGVLTL